MGRRMRKLKKLRRRRQTSRGDNDPGEAVREPAQNCVTSPCGLLTITGQIDPDLRLFLRRVRPEP